MSETQKALSAIQAKLHAPKGQVNNFGKYKYRSCEDILEALKPHLSEHGATLTISDEIIVVGDRFYVKASAAFSVAGESHVIVTAYAREPLTKKGMDEAQITGATSSYARKYALNGLFAIDDTKDADTQDNRQQGMAQQIDPAIQKIADAVLKHIENNDPDGIGEVWHETTAEEKEALWVAKTKGGFFSQEDKKIIREAATSYAKKVAGNDSQD